MNDVKRALMQVVYTNKAFVRNPASAFFTLVFPLMFLVIFSVIFGNGTIQVARDVTVSVATFYVPAIGAFSVITARGSPMPVWAYMSARIMHAVLIAVLLVAICAAFGAVFYHASLPTRTLPAFLLTLVVGAAAFSALGVAVTSIIPNADASPAVVNATVLPLLFISNVFIPLRDPPAWLDFVSKAFPIRHFSDALIGSFFSLSGSGIYTNDLLIVGAWGLAGLLLAIRFFAWEPRR
jgi:ABC-2 type transport system permease protein